MTEMRVYRWLQRALARRRIELQREKGRKVKEEKKKEGINEKGDGGGPLSVVCSMDN